MSTGAPAPSELDSLRRRRFGEFDDLMSRRVENIILASSLYDKFILQKDGRLSEVILGEFLDLHLHHTTGLTHVSSGAEVLARAKADPGRYQLVITATQLGDMNAIELACLMRAEGLDIPAVLLAYDGGELAEFETHHDTSVLERVFLWQGDTRILLALVKFVEDRLNLEYDVGVAGVQVILVIEDNVRFYSSFLPMIYTEVIEHSQQLIPEGINVAHKILRMRARPKILLCTNYEEAWDYFSAYHQDVLGVISDIEFPHEGERDPEAGVTFARRVKEVWKDIPVVLQSSRPENEALAREVGASFLLKGSPTLIQDLREVMTQQFFFGDFVFRLCDGTEVARARDMRELVEMLHTVPDESLTVATSLNAFSRWLKARTEFALAALIRPRRMSDFRDASHVRADLLQAIEDYRREQSRALIGDFDRDNFDPCNSFSRIGGGSLGGKARALAFVRHLLNLHEIHDRFPGVEVTVPPAVVLATEVFDEFLESNDLRSFAVNEVETEELRARFQAATLPPKICRDLAAYLELATYPLAVRSSSLLEDSQYQPLAGIYDTFMLPNTDPDPDRRLAQLQAAIKAVYASAFSQRAKTYLEASPYRLEEEKMAVIVQRVVGSRHADRFYPDVSGVARSYDFYPVAPAQAEDGVVSVALGLGRTVVRGEAAHSFSPRYPRQVRPTTLEQLLEVSQHEFWSLVLDTGGDRDRPDLWERRFPLSVAEADGTLGPVASTYDPDNEAVYDGLARPGIRVVTFAPLLKYGLFPLPEALELLLRVCSHGMAGPVEIEFAVNLSLPKDKPKEFACLQVRPMALSREHDQLDLSGIEPERVLCASGSVLGNGRRDGIRDVVVVDVNRFDRAHSREAAREVARINADLVKQRTPYLLIGVGRWGSADPWLGIPVTWEQILGARVIVEAELADVPVDPSQGSHFFQNLTSFQVGYFTVRDGQAPDDFVNWEWLAAQPAVREQQYTRHLRFEHPLVVKMNGKERRGVVLKPEE